jgi:uncharacterized protein
MVTLNRVVFSTLLVFIGCFSFLAAETLPDVEVMIPMRDGMGLPTNVYFPEGKSGKYPCVLVRQPLGKDYVNPAWLEVLKDGYMLAVQSTRSFCDKTGKELPYVSDGWGPLSDGYDTVEWLANCEWTNGKVATIGASATGITELLLAPSQPKHLVCQFIEVAAPSLYQYAVWPGGQFRKEQVEGWLKAHKRDPSVAEWLSKKNSYDDFWRSFNALAQAKRIQVPQLHIGGWFDIFLQGTLDAFNTAQTLSEDDVKDKHKLIIGPWAHGFRRASTLGDFAAVEKGKQPPHEISFSDWLNFHVKGLENNVAKAPPVQYFVMGPFDGSSSSGNEWRAAHKWPPDAIYTQMYLKNDNLLQDANLQTEETALAVSFDPQNPVPTVGGRNLFLPDGPKDLRSIESRKDVIVFTTEPLKEDLEVTGKIGACIFASNVHQERDICLRLTDVYPDGKSVLIAEGVSHALAQEDNSPQPHLVDLWSTSMIFAKGHKIRLTVSGSNYPAFQASLTANPESAKTEANLCFSIHTGGKYSSYIALPVIQKLEASVCAPTEEKSKSS